MQRAVKTCRFFEMRKNSRYIHHGYTKAEPQHQHAHVLWRVSSSLQRRRVQRVLWLCINMFFYRHCPKYNWVFARKSGIFHPFTSRAQHLLTVTSHTQVIKEILKPSGYWINLGPLQYHWYEFGMNATGTGLDSRYQESIELSYDELKQAILKLDFTFLHEEVGRSCHYNALNKMKKQVYDCSFFTVQK